MTETIALITNRSSRPMDFDRIIGRVFADRQSAWTWQNKQFQNYTVRALDGKWKKGQVIPLGTPTRDLLAPRTAEVVA